MNWKRLAFWAGMAVTFGCLYYAVSSMDVRKALFIAKNAHFGWIIPFMFANLAAVYFRALRLRHLTWGIKEIPAKSLFSAISIGLMGNMLFPMRIGELMQVYTIAKKENVSKSGIFATLVLEKTFDLIVILTILFLTLLLTEPSGISPETWNYVQRTGVGTAIIVAAATGALYWVAIEHSVSCRQLDKLMGLFPEKAANMLQPAIAKFRTGLRVFTSRKHAIGATLHSLTMWGMNASLYLLVMPLFGLPISIEMACMMMVLSGFSMLIPSSPGFVGPFHAAIILAMKMYGINGDVALGISIFLHAAIFFFSIALGLIFAWYERLGLSELRYAGD